MWVSRAIHNHLALINHLTVMHQHMLVLGNQEFVRYAIHVGNHQALLAFGFLTEGSCTCYFSQHARIFRRTRFEQLRYAWQTAGNITGLGRLLRYTRQHFTYTHVLTIFYSNNTAGLESHG